MTNQEYETNEARLLHKQLEAVRLAPLADRKAAQADMLQAMRDDPALVAERVSWLIDGNYGYGSYTMIRRILASRCNKPAALVQLVGALEWGCPERLTANAWHALTANQQEKLNKLVLAEIETTESAIA